MQAAWVMDGLGSRLNPPAEKKKKKQKTEKSKEGKRAVG
jgi:hypothetical protein